MKYCINCGNKIEEGIGFCEKCGQKIDNFSVASTSTLRQANKTDGIAKNIRTLILCIIFGGIFAILVFLSQSENNYNSVPIPSAHTDSPLQITDDEQKTSSMEYNFVCPENYQDSKTQNADLEKLLTEYLNKNPQSTINDVLTYRYSMLVKNNCQKTLDNIKNRAEGEDPLSSYIEKTIKGIE